jgi:hypothetical protein
LHPFHHIAARTSLRQRQLRFTLGEIPQESSRVVFFRTTLGHSFRKHLQRCISNMYRIASRFLISFFVMPISPLRCVAERKHQQADRGSDYGAQYYAPGSK